MTRPRGRNGQSIESESPDPASSDFQLGRGRSSRARSSKPLAQQLCGSSDADPRAQGEYDSDSCLPACLPGRHTEGNCAQRLLVTRCVPMRDSDFANDDRSAAEDSESDSSRRQTSALLCRRRSTGGRRAQTFSERIPDDLDSARGKLLAPASIKTSLDQIGMRFNGLFANTIMV